MAGAFPVFADGESTRSGLVHSLEIRAEVHQFRSGVEQRYAVSGLLNSFTLPYTELRWSEVEQLRDFFVLQKGAFDHAWTLDLRDPANGMVRRGPHVVRRYRVRKKETIHGTKRDRN